MICKFLGHNWQSWVRNYMGVVYMVRIRVCRRCGKFHREDELQTMARRF